MLLQVHLRAESVRGAVCVGWFRLLTFLVPPLASSLAPYNLAVEAIGELALTLWLLIFGVNVHRWTEQASAAGASLRTSKTV